MQGQALQDMFCFHSANLQLFAEKFFLKNKCKVKSGVNDIKPSWETRGLAKHLHTGGPSYLTQSRLKTNYLCWSWMLILEEYKPLR